MLGPEGLDADWADRSLVGGKVVRLEVLTRVAAVRAEFATKGAAHLPHPRLLAVQLGQVVQVVRVPHYDLFSA